MAKLVRVPPWKQRKHKSELDPQVSGMPMTQPGESGCQWL